MTTLGTRLFTLFHGRAVGTDTDGRRYYEERRPRTGALRARRWVAYLPGEDASSVPAEWWGWLHHMDAAPLPETVRQPWQRPFEPNLTGTPLGYHPPGSDYMGGVRPKATGDYEAWSPDAA